MLRRIIYVLKGFFKDENGYWRNKNNHLIHRIKAYKIYIKDKNKYPLPYEFYIVSHVDGNKDNNKKSNLILLTPIEYNYKKRKIIRRELPYIMRVSN